MTPLDVKAEIVKRLSFALRRDIRKDDAAGCPGLRSTTNIADYFGPACSRRTILAALNSLYEAGTIDWYGAIEGLGAAHWWRIALNDNGPDDGETVEIGNGLPIAA